jgi:hypothetical protein
LTSVIFRDGAEYTDTQETSVELFYKIQITPYLSVQPDLQYVINPGGNGASDALVCSRARTHQLKKRRRRSDWHNAFHCVRGRMQRVRAGGGRASRTAASAPCMQDKQKKKKMITQQRCLARRRRARSARVRQRLVRQQTSQRASTSLRCVCARCARDSGVGFAAEPGRSSSSSSSSIQHLL